MDQSRASRARARAGRRRLAGCAGWPQRALRVAAGPLVAATLLLAGCAAAPVPATVWLRLSAEEATLPAAAPGAAAAPAGAAGAAAVPGAAGLAGAAVDPVREVWQLVQPVAMPGHLERDALFVPQGAAGAWVRPLAGARWVEPLRDAIPRVLREDLMRRMGGQVLWWAPLPPGLVPTRQLRVELAAFEISADGRTLATHARWSIADARGARAPEVHEARLQTPAAAPAEAESWAVAHRQALSTLAARIAATMVARER